MRFLYTCRRTHTWQEPVASRFAELTDRRCISSPLSSPKLKFIYKKVNCGKRVARRYSCHKFFARAGRGRLCKIFLLSSLITVRNLVAMLSYDVGVRRWSQNFRGAGARSLEIGIVDDYIRTWSWTFPHMCYHGDSTKCAAGRICGADSHWSVLIT